VVVAVIASISLAGLVGALVVGRTHPAAIRLAFVAGMSGPNAATSEDMLRGAQLYVAEVNAAGGVRGRRVELVVYDDKDDGRLAHQRAEEIAGDRRILGVIGHRTSTASLAAGPVYAGAGMPAITPTSTADAVTKDNPWFFRMVFTNGAEGRFMSGYLRQVLGEQTITVVAGTDDYSRNLAEGVLAGWPELNAERVLRLDTSSTPSAEAVDDVARRAEADVGSGTVVMALPEPAAERVVPALRRSGFFGRIFGGDTIGAEEFFQSVSGLPDAGASGDLTDNVYATVPLINDALTGDGVRWYSAFLKTYGKAPTWRAATSYQSALVLVSGLRSALVARGPQPITEERARLRTALSDLNSPERSLHGIIGPIWFGDERASVMPLTVGLGREGHFVSAFEQLQPTASQTGAGVIVTADGSRYERKRVVTVGIQLNQISDLATDTENFEADFFLWLKFSGDDDVTDIEFANAVDPSTALGTPARSSTDGGVSYRLYRIRGRFRTALEFHDSRSTTRRSRSSSSTGRCRRAASCTPPTSRCSRRRNGNG